MKTTSFKKVLLAGSAIVAVGAFGATQAHAATITSGASGTWGEAHTQTNATINDAAAGADVNLNAGATLTITNDGTATDGTGVNSFILGAVTNTAGTGIITAVTGGNNPLTIVIDSASVGGAVSFTTTNAALTAETVTVNHNLTVGGALNISDVSQNTAAKTISVAVGGNLDVTGTTALHAGIGAFADGASLTVTGTSHFGGAVTVTGGVDATAPATLTLNGATNAFDAGLTLTNGAAGHAILALNGLTVAQAVTGNITGTGDITVANAAGVTFNGTTTAGTITIENGAGALNSAATFKNTVAAPITLGGAGTGTNTVTFDATGGNFGVTGAIAGAAGGETDNIVVLNTSGAAKTVTLNTASVTNLDNLSVSGVTTLVTANNLTLGTGSTIGSGSTVSITGGTFSGGAIANSGTIALNGGTGFAGTITGTGSLDINSSGAFNGSVTQSSADIAAFTLTQSAASGWNVGTTNFSGAGTLALLGGSQTVAGNFTNTTDGQGTVSITAVAGTTAFTGNLGASAAHSLAALTLIGNAGNAVTTTGNLYVDAIGQGATDTIQFLGNSPQTVSGAITGGILTVGNNTTTSDVTFGSNSSGVTLNVDTHAKATFAGNETLTGNITNTGTIQVNKGKTLQAAAVVDASVGTYNIEVGKAAGTQTNGTIIETTASAADYSNDTVHFIVNSLQPLTTGASVLSNVFQGNGSNSIVAGATVTDNSYLYSFALIGAVDANVDVTASVAHTIADAATASANVGVGNELFTTLAASTNQEINEAQSNLVSAGSRREVNDVLESTRPTADGGDLAAGLAFTGETSHITSERLAMLRDDAPATGMAAGEVGKGMGVWGQVFGTHGNQDERDGVAGYDVDSYGLAVGGDTSNLNDKMVVGAALSYAHSKVDSDNVDNANTDIDSYQLALYGDYDIDSRTYVAGQVGYVWSSNDTDRHNVGGVSGLSAFGSYDSNEILARAEVGRNFMAQQGMKLTPKAMVDYTYFNPDSYTEHGAGGLNLNVDEDSMNVFNVGLGVDASWIVKHASGAWCEPALHASVRYDLANDNVQSTNSFTGGGTAFSTDGVEQARTTFDAGAGLTYHATTNWDIKAEYNFEAKSDYTSHSGLLKAGYKF